MTALSVDNDEVLCYNFYRDEWEAEVGTMFEEVLKAVKQWLYVANEKYKDKLSIKVVRDTCDDLLVNIDSDMFVSELNVSKPDFRPYRYVSLFVADKRKADDQQPAFVFYDKENDTIAYSIDEPDNVLALILSEK